MAEHVFREVHHAVVVGVRLIELHERKLRIVARVDTLIAEHSADLVDALQPADDQSLEVELERNAELDILVERVVVGLEGSCRGAAGVRDQHGGLDLHEALLVQKTADLRDDLAALDKGIAHVLVHDEVDIALTVARIAVGEPVPLLRQRL